MTAAPIRKSVTVAAPAGRAFALFTEGFGTWWPASHTIGAAPARTVTIEPRAGGRWYETGTDGTECDWGAVLAWEPPRRILLAWRIGIDWRFDPALLTEVEVRFTPEGPQTTRIDLEHRLLDGLPDPVAARAVFDAPRGWAGLLAAFAAKADRG